MLRLSRCALALAVVGTLGVCLAAPASAQQREPQGPVAPPFSGLFGNGPAARNRQSLDVRGSLFGARQSVRIPAGFDTSLLDPRFQRSATFAAANGSLSYAYDRSGANGSLSAYANGLAADYSTAIDRPYYSAGGGLGLSTRLTRRTDFSASASTTYSPSFGFQPLQPGALDPASLVPNLGYAGIDLATISATATAGVSHRLTRRSTVSANLGAQEQYFLDNSDNNVLQVTSTALYSQQIFRKLSFHAGYSRTQARYADQSRTSPPTQNADFGLDYADALQLRLTRRTTLGFAVSLGSAKALNGQTQYRALGNANLHHSMGRTWTSDAGYSRTLSFVSAFRQPVLADNAFASLGGQPFRRGSFSANAYYTRGYIGLDTSNFYDSYSASTSLSIALTRKLAAFAQYAYYGNRVPVSASSLPILPSFARQVFSVGLSVWSPIFSSPRSRRDTR